MWRMVAGQVLRRRGRSLAVVAAIVVAAVSFSLLSASVATSRLQVQGTVEANFRSAYDILVRPAGSQTGLEVSDRLVRENYLSGIFGGITMRQYRDIVDMPGVEVAAPVAMVGYILPSLFTKKYITDLVNSDQQQLYRINYDWITDRGLSVSSNTYKYIYVTGQRVRYRPGGGPPVQTDPVTGERLQVCSRFDRHIPAATSAFDRRARTQLSCFSTNPPSPYSYEELPSGEVGTHLAFPFPMLLAAIDPVQEAKLVGLDGAVTDGRYLSGSDKPVVVPADPSGKGSLKYRRIPVMMADQPLTDEKARISVERLDAGDPTAVPGRLAGEGAIDWLHGLAGSIERTEVLTTRELYPQLLRGYSGRAYLQKPQYWSTGQVRYRADPDGHLEPIPRRNPPETWVEPLLQTGYFAPPEASDIGFRRLRVHIGSNQITPDDTAVSPIFRSVGTFDPNQITGFGKLSQVPLTTYYPPSADPGDERTDRLLDGQPLLPNNNLAGYLQQPPMMLTNLNALPALTDPTAFYGARTTRKAPISVIRVRVAGVTGIDELSQERVRLVAERVARDTGLDVDVTIGSSPTPKLIDLPAGDNGRPALTLKEGWVQKGVGLQLLSAIDTKSLALFGLVLIVCLLSLLNATIAAVRTRRAELGVLACLGWPPRRIFSLLIAELLATGLVAGLIGTVLAVAIGQLSDLHVAAWQLAAITPTATLLAALAGLWPAWRACAATPMAAISPPVRAPRRAGLPVRGITGLAATGIVRSPGRTLLGAASLFIGVAALAVLVAIQQAFQGGVAGTLLGDVVAVQVRGVDYLAAALTIGLGAFAVADTAYLNIAERTAEIGTYRASGWTDQHVRRLFGSEAALTAALGALTGAALAVTATALIFPIPLTTALAAAATAATVGLATSALAVLVPLTALNRLAPAHAVSSE